MANKRGESLAKVQARARYKQKQENEGKKTVAINHCKPEIKEKFKILTKLTDLKAPDLLEKMVIREYAKEQIENPNFEKIVAEFKNSE